MCIGKRDARLVIKGKGLKFGGVGFGGEIQPFWLKRVVLKVSSSHPFLLWLGFSLLMSGHRSDKRGNSHGGFLLWISTALYDVPRWNNDGYRV